MYFHHLHFYVKDTSFWKHWFTQKLAFQPQVSAPARTTAKAAGATASRLEGVFHNTATISATSSATSTEILKQGSIEIRLSAPQADEVAEYLSQHPPGLADVALATESFSATLSNALQQGAQLLRPVSLNSDGQRQCQLKGWKHLRHTLIEVSPQWVSEHQKTDQHWLQAVDHVVMNVAQGELDNAVGWYQRVFGLERSQSFEINTARSGLRSQVLVHPDGSLQLPINEPTSINSQVQEFLDHNRGAGVQHVALRSHSAIQAIAHFRQQGLSLIDVPDTYYQNLSQRSDCPLLDLSSLEQQRLLIDWPQGGQQGMLLQTFTQPIFAEPTFFFEIIERRTYEIEGRLESTQGFGEGNFQALFEAIERSQLERGSLRDG